LQPEQEQRASERLVQAPGRQALPEVLGPVQERRALQPVRLEQQVLRQVREQVLPASVPERQEPLEPEQVRLASVQLVPGPGRPVLRRPERQFLQPKASHPV
jgi:hypothetical protein